MNDFYAIANRIAKIPDEEISGMSWEDRLNELVHFRDYLNEYYGSYDDNYVSFLEKGGKETDLEEKYSRKFEQPERFFKTEKGISSVKYEQDQRPSEIAQTR